jgi:hypothetical protein
MRVKNGKNEGQKYKEMARYNIGKDGDSESEMIGKKFKMNIMLCLYMFLASGV